MKHVHVQKTSNLYLDQICLKQNFKIGMQHLPIIQLLNQKHPKKQNPKKQKPTLFFCFAERMLSSLKKKILNLASIAAFQKSPASLIFFFFFFPGRVICLVLFCVIIIYLVRELFLVYSANFL